MLFWTKLFSTYKTVILRGIFPTRQESRGPFAKKRSEKSLKSSVKIKAYHGLLGPNCPWWLGFTGFSPPTIALCLLHLTQCLRNPQLEGRAVSPVLIRTNSLLQIMDLADTACLLHWIYVFWVLVNSFTCGHLHSLRCWRGEGTLISVKRSQQPPLLRMNLLPGRCHLVVR